MIIDKFSTSSIKQLVDAARCRHGFLSDDSEPFEYGHFLETLDDRVEKMEMPDISFTEFFLTSQCNMACDYCFIEGKENVCDKMDWNTAKKSVDFLIKNSGKAKRLSILFFGGEPMLEFDLLKKIVAYSSREVEKVEKEIHFTMTTNGTLMTEEKARFMADNKISYMVSLDGRKDDHDRHRFYRNGEGSFDLLLENLDVMKRYNPRLSVRVTPFPDTVANLFENVKYLIELGLREFVIGMAHGNIPEWKPEHRIEHRHNLILLFNWLRDLNNKTKEYRSVRINCFDDLFRQYRSYLGPMGMIRNCKDEKESPSPFISHCGLVDDSNRAFSSFGCRGGMGYVCISPKGKLFPCSLLLGRKDQEGIYPLGDVFRGVDEPRRKEFMLLNANRQKNCMDCEACMTCSGGCPGNNFDATGKVTQVNAKQCDTYKQDLILARSLNLIHKFRQESPGISVTNVQRRQNDKRQ